MDRVIQILEALGLGSGGSGSSTAGLEELIRLLGTLGSGNHGPITINITINNYHGSTTNNITNNNYGSNNNNNNDTAQPAATASPARPTASSDTLQAPHSPENRPPAANQARSEPASIPSMVLKQLMKLSDQNSDLMKELSRLQSQGHNTEAAQQLAVQYRSQIMQIANLTDGRVDLNQVTYEMAVLQQEMDLLVKQTRQLVAERGSQLQNIKPINSGAEDDKEKTTVNHSAEPDQQPTRLALHKVSSTGQQATGVQGVAPHQAGPSMAITGIDIMSMMKQALPQVLFVQPKEPKYEIEQTSQGTYRVCVDGLETCVSLDPGCDAQIIFFALTPFVRLFYWMFRIIAPAYLDSPEAAFYKPSDQLDLVTVSKRVPATLVSLPDLGMLWLSSDPLPDGQEVLIKGRRFRVAGAVLRAIK